MASQKSNNRHVNHLLHTLRGEQFRHIQNVRKSRDHVSSSYLRNKPTLPIDLAALDYDFAYQPSTEDPSGTRDSRAPTPSSTSPAARCSGPAAPKSWMLTPPKQDRYDTLAWRSAALSLLFKELGVPSIPGSDTAGPPPLTMLCLEELMTRCTLSELREDILPYIPPHLRASWVRYTTIHAPLPNSRLFAFYEQQGHADGEILVVGPNNSIRDDYFLHNGSPKADEDVEGQGGTGSSGQEEPDEDWDAEDYSPTLLHTVAILSTRLSMATVLSFPPTITHLALVNLSIPLQLHRLPQVCPLLVFLDLSYNDWLAAPFEDATQSWDRIDWNRWSQLKTLGLRECEIPEEKLQRINRGRWDDITIIR